MVEIKDYVSSLAKRCKAASYSIAKARTEEKNALLRKMAQALRDRMDEIIKANEKDMAWGRENGLSKAMLDRLLLNEKRIESMATSL